VHFGDDPGHVAFTVLLHQDDVRGGRAEPADAGLRLRLRLRNQRCELKAECES
jgi:hypothetical protein